MDPLAPAIGARTVTVALGALPWPLSIVAQHFAGPHLEAVKVATRPNPYTTAPSGSQAAIAADQAQRAALIGGMDGLAGSSSSWDHDQGRVSLDRTGLGQDLSSQAIAPSRMLPWWEQGHARDANTTRGYTGPVITPGKLAWGWSTRFRYPRIIAGTLLPPEARTPSAREMARGFVDTHPSQLRVDDPFLQPDDLEDW